MDKEAEFYRGYKGKVMYYFGITTCLGITVLVIFGLGNGLDISNAFMMAVPLTGAVFYILKYRSMVSKYDSENKVNLQNK